MGEGVSGRVVAAVVGALLFGFVSGCTFGVLTSGSAGASPASAAGCAQAFPVLVERINTAFTGGESVDDARMVSTPGGVTYVAGNIVRGPQLVSSGDVWLSRGGVLYALSSDARSLTGLPDGRVFGSAGDEYGSALVDCLTSP